MSNIGELSGESGGIDRPAKKQKQNKIEAFGGPMDDEETARKKLEGVGFDPDKPLDSTTGIELDGYYDTYLPMAYFCATGDLMMCRYLLSKGASTTQAWVDDYDGDDETEGGNLFCSPMYAAARGGYLEVCKWLFEHGARGDIRMSNDFYYSPLHIAFSKIPFNKRDENDRFRQICRWLILNEALCPNDDGVVCEDRIREARFQLYAKRKKILRKWASGAIREHDNFMVFLMGTHISSFSTEELRRLLNRKLQSSDSVSTIMESLSKHQQLYVWKKEQRQPSIVQCLSGHPGIRKHIADMIGVVRGRDLRILRGLGRGLTNWPNL